MGVAVDEDPDAEVVQEGEVTGIGKEGAGIEVRLGVDLDQIAQAGNQGEVFAHQGVVPRFVEQAGTVTGGVVVHLVGMAHDVEAAEVEHTGEASVVEAHHTLQVAAEVGIYNAAEGGGGAVDVHHLSPIVIEHVDGADAVVERQGTETVDGGVTRFVEVVNLQADVELDAVGILRFKAMELSEIVVHHVPLHGPRRGPRQGGVRGEAVGGEALAEGETDE